MRMAIHRLVTECSRLYHHCLFRLFLHRPLSLRQVQQLLHWLHDSKQSGSSSYSNWLLSRLHQHRPQHQRQQQLSHGLFAVVTQQTEVLAAVVLEVEVVMHAV